MIRDNRLNHIYLMHSAKTGLYKIGVSINPLRRLEEMRKTSSTIGGCDETIRVVCSWTVPRTLFGESKREAYRLEAELHTALRQKQVVGEWFDLNEDEVLYVYTYLKSRVA